MQNPSLQKQFFGSDLDKGECHKANVVVKKSQRWWLKSDYNVEGLLAHAVFVGLALGDGGWTIPPPTSTTNNGTLTICIMLTYPARVLRALWLLLADGAPTVGRGKTF